MNKLKAFLDKVKNNITLAILLSIISILVIVATIVLLCTGFQTSIVTYCMYALSALGLIYLVYVVIYFTPKIKNSIITILKKYKFTNELLVSFGYRSLILAIFSFLFNTAYAIMQGVIAILSHSIWYGALSTYYLALSLIRGGIVAISRKRKQKGYNITNQVKSYRNCGIYLVLLNFTLSSAIVQMVISNQGFKYAGIMIYVMAIYTFYKLSISIYNLVKARKHDNYMVQSIKNISFADSLVSVLALQTAMLQAFSAEYKPFLPNALTGGAVSLIIITLGIIMILKGNKKLKELQKEENHEQKI